MKDSAKGLLAICILSCLAVFESAHSTGRSAEQIPAQEVKRGDRVALHFFCRLSNGGLVASSRSGEELPADEKKSPLFVPREKGDPVVVLAGYDAADSGTRGRIGLEQEIMTQLAGTIVGVKVGEQHTLEIGAASGTPNAGEYLLPMARVRKRPKELRMPLPDFEARKGIAPAVGMPYTIDPAFPGTVMAVTDKEVIVRFSPPPDGQVDTPFGRGSVKEMEDHFELEIDARPGTLVRSGPKAGRIIKVDEHWIIVDYSHPFGGEVLVCEVSVLSADSPAASTAN